MCIKALPWVCVGVAVRGISLSCRVLGFNAMLHISLRMLGSSAMLQISLNYSNEDIMK